jgi:hypothetical protein
MDGAKWDCPILTKSEGKRMSKETCRFRKVIAINIRGFPQGVSLKPCCTHPEGPKVTGICGVPEPDPWYCDAAVEDGKCPLGEIDV